MVASVVPFKLFPTAVTAMSQRVNSGFIATESKRKRTTSCFQSALECRRNSKVGGKPNSSALTGVLSTKQGRLLPRDP